jgi:type I restriction enzyme R subunit
MPGMSTIGQRERATQYRAVKLFKNQLDYQYYGNWQDRADNTNIEETYLRDWLTKQGVEHGLITNAIRQFKQAATMGDGKKLYHANEEVYSLLRYGVKVRQGQDENTKTVWLIDWNNSLNNEFAIAEEVSVIGENTLGTNSYTNRKSYGVLRVLVVHCYA